jgi:hypothetical protein
MKERVKIKVGWRIKTEAKILKRNGNRRNLCTKNERKVISDHALKNEMAYFKLHYLYP